MVKVRYFVENMQLSQKNQRVSIDFRRIPTKTQLEKQENQNKNNSNRDDNSYHSLFSTMSLSFGNSDDDNSLNFGKISFNLPIKHVQQIDLRIGSVVMLDIPEEISDIKIMENDR